MPFDIANISIQPLRKEHQRGAFYCSNSTIQNYCQNNARRDHDAYKVRVYVACDRDSVDVLGYYYLSLTSYKVGRLDDRADAKFARVDAVPAVYLGMIGVHNQLARRGIGKLLMRDAMLQVVRIADLAGTYALTLDALDEELMVYYRDQFGFQSFKEGSGLEMYLPIRTIKTALGE